MPLTSLHLARLERLDHARARPPCGGSSGRLDVHLVSGSWPIIAPDDGTSWPVGPGVLAALLAGSRRCDRTDAAFTDSEVRAILAHGPWPCACDAGSEQPRLGQSRGGRVRRAPFLRRAPVRQRQVLLRHLPRPRAQLDRQPHARRGDRRCRSQHADADERAARALVRLGRRVPTASGRRASARSSMRGSSAPARATSPRWCARTSSWRAAIARASAPRPRRPTTRPCWSMSPRRLRPSRRPSRARATPFDRFRNTLARGEPVRPDVLRGRAARAADLHRQGSLQQLPQRAELHQRRVSRQRLLRRAARGCRTSRGREGCAGQPLQPRRALQRRPDAGCSAPSRDQEPTRPSAFKVPTLRHLMLTAPYGHHGGHRDARRSRAALLRARLGRAQAAQAHGARADRPGRVPGIRSAPSAIRGGRTTSARCNCIQVFWTTMLGNLDVMSLLRLGDLDRAAARDRL